MPKKNIFISSVPREGISPTEREFDEATVLPKYRICFFKTSSPQPKREPKQQLFKNARVGTLTWELPSSRLGDMSRIYARVGTHEKSVQAPIDFDFPLTIEQLYQVHESFPTNPLIANPLYLAGYAERLGTGTSDIIKKYVTIGLKPPTFSQSHNFHTTFWRNEETSEANPITSQPNPITSAANPIDNDASSTLPVLLAEGKLCKLFPETPNHPNQAYKAYSNPKTTEEYAKEL